MPGNPYDGHTLASVIPDIERKIGASLQRIVADRGYRGHNAPPDHKFKVFVTGQKRGMTKAIKREMRRRAAVEPVIGHAKSDHRMDRNYLAGSKGDAINAVLAGAGYNFRRLIAWLRRLWRAWFAIILANLTRSQNPDPRLSGPQPLNSPETKSGFFTDDQLFQFLRRQTTSA